LFSSTGILQKEAKQPKSSQSGPLSGCQIVGGTGLPSDFGARDSRG